MNEKTKLPEEDFLYGNCPKCGTSWKGEDLHDVFKKQREQGFAPFNEMTDQQIHLYIKTHYVPPYYGSNLLAIEISEKYDGISYYKCLTCETVWDRFTHEETDLKFPECRL